MTNPTFHDVEQLSARLDGKLSPAEAARLENKIQTDPELASVYKQLAQSQAILRQLPARRAPRNFTLTPKMAGVKAPTPRSVPFFQFASALAGVLLMLTFAANSLASVASPGFAAAPMQAMGKGGGPLPADTNDAHPESGGEQPALAPAATQAPALSVAPGFTSTPETEMRMSAEPTQPMALSAPSQSIVPEAAPMPEAVSPPAFQIPAWLQISLLALALFTGGAAWLTNRKANANFSRRNPK